MGSDANASDQASEPFHVVFSDLLGKHVGAPEPKRRWTDKSFGEAVGVDARTVANWKSGQTLPDHWRYQAICDVGFKIRPPESDEERAHLWRLSDARRMTGFSERERSRTNFLLDEAKDWARYAFVYARPSKRSGAKRAGVRQSKTKEVRFAVEANALRLVGRDWAFHRSTDVHVDIDSGRYVPPAALDVDRAAIVARLKAHPKYHNGPHTRLIHCEEPMNDVRSERRGLTLRLGPLDWEEFAVVRHITDDLLARAESSPEAKAQLRERVPVAKICAERSPIGAHTPCILDTATTLVTSDGWLAFGVRTKEVQHFVGQATSAVAENIHQYLDESLVLEANRAHPSPFRAALRGIAEEVSSGLLPSFHEARSLLLCTGISFDLFGLHPDALFLALLHETRAQVEAMPPPKDVENKILWIPLDRDEAIFDALSAYRWTGAGFASVVRTCEVLDGHRRLWRQKSRLSAAKRLLRFEASRLR